MAKVSVVDFVRQVRQETAKVTWPTRRETLIGTAMVFVMAAFAAVFFFAVDMVISQLVKLVLGLGG